jgi:hypothetical protein
MDYNSLLCGKLIMFSFCNYGIVLGKVSHVILGLFQLILLFVKLLFLFVALVEILAM